MVFIILIIVFIGALFLGKHYYRYWFNPLSTYSSVWFVLIFLYELKLFRYYDLQTETWLVIILSFISYLIGSIIIFFARSSIDSKNVEIKNEFSDDNLLISNERYLKLLIISTGLIGLIGGLQHWLVLLNKFGSIQNVLVYANIIYRMRVEGEIGGIIPYLSAFGFVSLFFASVYSAYRREISLLVFLPLIAIILKDLANIGRVFMLFAFLEFITVYLLFRYFNPQISHRRKFNKQKLVIIFLIFITLIVASATFVKFKRGAIEQFKGTSNTLQNLNIAHVISPSIYLYFSSDVGVLNSFLIKDDEKTRFGENTFMPIYNLLAKFGFVEKPDTYQRGYYIPMWVNTGSYLRELYADFGILGITIVPFMLGFSISYLWLKSMGKGKLIVFTILCYLIILVLFSFLMVISRLGNWSISLIIICIIISISNQILKPRVI